MDHSTKEPSGRSVFLSFLGTSLYTPISYLDETGESAVCSKPTRFVQVARLESLRRNGEQIDKACIFVTERARRANWEDGGHADRKTGQIVAETDGRPHQGLESCLRSMPAELDPIDIPAGTSTSELWEIFEAIQGRIEPGDRMHVDVTHSFRSIPIIVLMALDYLVMVKDATLESLTYGAFEAAVGREDGRAPIFDLTPFLSIRDWTTAGVRLLKGGDMRGMGEVADAEVRRLAKVLRADTPRELRMMGGAFKRMGDALLHCRSGDLAREASLLEGLLRNGRTDCFCHDETKPLVPVLDRILPLVAKLKGESKDLAVAELESIAGAVEWCIRFDLHMQALTMLREAFVSVLAIMVGWQDRDRHEQDRLFSALGHHCRNKCAVENMDLFTPRIVERVGPSAAELPNIRNPLDHAGTASPVPPTAKVKAAAKKHLAALRSALAEMG